MKQKHIGLLATILIALSFCFTPAFADDPCTDPANCPELVVDEGCLDCDIPEIEMPSLPPVMITADGFGSVDTIQISNLDVVPPCSIEGFAAIGTKFEGQVQLPTGPLVDSATGTLSLAGAQLHTFEDTATVAGFDFTNSGQQYNNVSASVEADHNFPVAAIEGEDVATNFTYADVHSNGLEAGLDAQSCLDLSMSGLNPEFQAKHSNIQQYQLKDQLDPSKNWMTGQSGISWDINPTPPVLP